MLTQGRQQWAASARGDADGADALEDTDAHWSARLANALRADSQRTHSGAGERRMPSSLALGWAPGVGYSSGVLLRAIWTPGIALVVAVRWVVGKRRHWCEEAGEGVKLVRRVQVPPSTHTLTFAAPAVRPLPPPPSMPSFQGKPMVQRFDHSPRAHKHAHLSPSTSPPSLPHSPFSPPSPPHGAAASVNVRIMIAVRTTTNVTLLHPCTDNCHICAGTGLTPALPWVYHRGA